MVTGPGSFSAGTRSIVPHDIKDGAANTLAVVEASGLNVVWTEPRDFDVARQPVGVNLKGLGRTDSPGLMSSYHQAGAQGAFADGSVRFINENIDPRVLKALTTIDSGDVVKEF